MYNSILNKDVYLKRMQVGIYDKCWWVDKLYPEVDTVIDFGFKFPEFLNTHRKMFLTKED